jgi:hypothetical protein
MAPAALLTQDDLRRWRDCPRAFWLHRQPGEALPWVTVPSADERDDPLIDAGPSAEQALRATFPQACVIRTPHTQAEWDVAIQRTQAKLAQGFLAQAKADEEGRALIGACLRSAEGVQVRIDVLAAGRLGLRVLKTRFATVGQDADVDTVALWAHVLARGGWRIQGMGLLLIDTDFVYPGHGCYAGLFREVDLAPVLGSRSVPDWLVAMRQCEQGGLPTIPEAAPCARQGGCDVLEACGATPAPNTTPAPDSLETMGRELAAELRAEGHLTLATVTEARLPDARRQRAWRAVLKGAPELDAALPVLIRELPHPRALLRIDTIGYATPIWPGTQPYQVLPCQWTCEIETPTGAWQSHAFLAGPDGDPRRHFATTLLNALGKQGAVIAYNAGFERNRLRELAAHFPDLAPALDALQARIVDLFQIARGHAYHPAMCGSWSFAAITRAFAPDLATEGLDGQDGLTPQTAFAMSISTTTTEAERQALRMRLLAHGQREAAVLMRLLACFEAGPAA